MKSFLKSIRIPALAAAGASLVIGAALSAWLGSGSFLVGWLGTSVLLFLCLLGLLAAWRLAGGGRALAWLVAVAFILRLGTGLLITWEFPRLTDTDDYITHAGFYFRDAYARDREAWAVAQSGLFFNSSMRADFMADQYGGMLVLSAITYRLLSPDVHRFYLILILTAAAGAFSLPFFWAATRKKWGMGIALPAAWALALYPEGVLLGSTQMREPFIIALSAVMFWGAVTWPSRKRLALVAFASGLLGLLLLTPPMALAIGGIILGWWFIEEMGRKKGVDWPRWGWLVIAAGGVAMLAVMGKWLLSTSVYEIGNTLSGSDRMQGLLASFPGIVKALFIVGKGLTEPILPAAVGVLLGKGTPMILMLINFVNSLGWYALAPFLVYAGVVVFQVKDKMERRGLIWLAAASYVWILVASTRAGGDQYDNPRYRAIFLIFFALLAGMSWNWARVHHDAWLGRWLAVEGVFLFFFTGWYLKRYTTTIGFKLPFWDMVGAIIFFSALILGGGWAWDRYHHPSHPTGPSLTRPPESL